MNLNLLGYIKDKVYYSLNRHFSNKRSHASSTDIKIFVVRHCAGKLPSCFDDRSIYYPINCGSGPFGEHEEHELFDSAGVNISEYNVFLNEMTGIWWIAHHLQELGNPQYIGVNHYRRFLEWCPRILKPNVIVSTSTLNRKPISSFFVDSRGPFIASTFKRVFYEVFTENEYRDFDAYLNSHIFNRCNLFIMERNAFLRYASFMDRIIARVIQMIQENVIPIEGPSAFSKRIYGLFLEQMTSYWIFHQSCSGMKIIHAAVQAV